MVTIDLCCDDVIKIHDGDGPNSGVLLTLDQTTLATDVVISSGNKIYIHMSLQKHWGCTGVLLKYVQGTLCKNCKTNLRSKFRCGPSDVAESRPHNT